MESGTSIDTAVPDLTSIINDKQEWRAIIIRIEDESHMKEFPSDPQNPFHFNMNRNASDIISESPVPLVRLTQMLGGVPSPDIKFEREQIYEPNKAPHMIYNPVSDPDEDETYKRLTEKYFHNSNPPTEIVMISLRKKRDKRVERVKEAWRTQKESGSSDFWKSNRYPSICRFLVFDVEQQGSTKESADMFNLWTSVLLLTTNKLDPNIIQAYKLYNISVLFNVEAMVTIFRRTVNRLLIARQFITEGIKQDAMRLAMGENELPDFRMDVPVEFRTPRNVDFHVRTKPFKFVSRSTNSDVNKWEEMKLSVEVGLRTVFRDIERNLDQTVDRMRDYFTYSEGEVVQFNKYQLEDFNNELANVYADIMEQQQELPKTESFVSKELLPFAKKVKDKVLSRITKQQTLCLLAIVASLSLLSVIHPALFYIHHGYGTVWSIVVVFVVFFGVPVFIGFLAILFQKSKLQKCVDEYNRGVNRTLVKLSKNTALYSKYMSAIISHSRGRSYLGLMNEDMHSKDNSYASKQRHIQSINGFLQYINDLSIAFYIPFEMETTGDDDITVDTEIAPNINSFYTFESEMNYQIPINTMGDVVYSPFEFVEKLQIVREEIYDDNGYYK